MFPQVSLLLLGCTGLLTLSGCGAASGGAGKGLGPPPKISRVVISARQVPDEPYLLHVGDYLEIYVWGNTEGARKVQIREDGSIFFPPAGTIPAAGRAIRELEKGIQKQLNQSMLPEEELTPLTAPHSLPPQKTISLQEARNHAYLLQAGDRLDISVYGHADLEKSARIRVDGAFTFPLIGRVKASGRSLLAVEQTIQERLEKDYLINPQVTAQLMDAEFSILREGTDSGSVPIGSGMDFLTAVSHVGEVTSLGTSRVEILRELGDQKIRILANVNRVLQGKDPNIPILPRDTLYVKLLSGDQQITVRLIEATFTALGDVSRPGPQLIDGPTDLLTALSLAGGVTKFGSSNIEIIRTQGDRQLVIRVNVDRILQGKDPNISVFPRDTIYVRRRLF